MLSTKESLEALEGSQQVPSTVLAELKENQQRGWILDLALIVISASMGVGLFIFYRYLVRISTALRELQTVDHDILSSITRGIATANLQGEITSCNRALEQILEVSAGELIGRSLDDPSLGEDDLCLLLRESIKETARPKDMDFEYSSRSGRTMPLRVTTFALKNDVGKRMGGILLVKDMSEIHKMEERVHRASRLAALGELTQRLVHEIRNPLSAMDINIQLLEEYLGVNSEDPDIARYLDIISKETRRLNKVLRSAQVFATPQLPAFEKVDLHWTIRQALFLLEEEAHRQGVEIADNLQASESFVRADADQMKQVFINLFKNSIEAMVEGGKLEVNTRNDGDGSVIGVELVDSGSGIPLTNLQRIFDPFFTTKQKGTGLGLSIVHNIIAQHGGTMDVTSWLGDGTIFSIVLPLATGGEADDGDTKA
jgi:two-component system sensor histidine kinase AtoS